jgi:hypothetical protein
VASFVYNIWKQKLALGDSIWDVNPAAGDTMKIALVEAVLSDKTITDVDTALGSNEYGDTDPYIRTAVSGQGVTVDGTKATLDATDTTVTAIEADGSDKVEGLLLYHDVDGTDGNAIPIVFFDLANAFYGNGSNVTFVWDSTGVITLT